MAKLKEHILNQEQHSRMVFNNLRDALAKAKELNQSHNKAMHSWKDPVSLSRALALTHRKNQDKHQSTQTWSADMPDLEGKALADAERQFDYDSWLGEHGIGE